MKKLLIIFFLLVTFCNGFAQIRASHTLASWKTWFSLTGTNSGDVTLAGAPNYLTIAGQVITLAAVDLSGSNATGTLAAGRFPALLGDVTNTAGNLTTTVGAIQGKSITLATGYLKYTGSAWAFDNSTFLTGNQTITLSGDVSGSGATAITATIGANKVTTTTINNSAVTLAKIANAAANSVLVGSGAAGTGTAYSEISLGSGLAMTGTTLSATGTGGTVTSVDVAIGGMTSSGAITTSGTITMTGALNVNRGGTGAATLASNGILYGAGTSALNVLAVNATATNKFLTQSSSAAPAWATLVSGDIPNNGANTTGSAATLTTPRAIYGNNFDGSAALTQIIASTYGGTGNGFAKLSGPTSSEKTFTLPDASATILTDNAAVTVAQGGTGRSTLTNHGLLIGAGTSALTQLAVPAVGQILTSVASADPAWSATPTLGIAGTTAGTLALTGVTSGTVTIATADAAGTWTLKLPTTGGTNNYVLSTNGSGVTSWVAQSGGGMTNPMTTTGDIIYSSDGSGTPARLAVGTAAQFLGGGSIPTWGNTLALLNATTNAIDNVLTLVHNSSGTTAANFGEQLLFNLSSSTTSNRNAAAINVTFSTATDASRTSKFALQLVNNAGSLADVLTVSGAGIMAIPNLASGLVTSNAGTLSANTIAAGQVVYASSTTAALSSANLLWDNTNKYLTIGATATMNVPLGVALTTATTNAVQPVLDIYTICSGTPVANFGASLRFRATNATTNRYLAEIQGLWTDITDATRTGAITFKSTYQASALTEMARIALSAATTATLTVGLAGTTTGNLNLVNATGSNAISIAAPASPSAYTLTLPTDGGTVGYFARTNGSGTVTWQHNASYQAAPGTPAGTVSAVGVMMGLGGAATITPNTSGQVFIIISGDVANSNALGGCKVQLRYGTGTAPANGAAITGTALGGNVVLTSAIGANDAFPFTVQGIVTGLTVATTYWLDLQVTATTAGTATVADISISANEF